METNASRHLAAIMFADMVGYTALMQGDEGEARVQRDRHRRILSNAVTRHRGRVLQHYGDGSLCIFASAVEAVECALEIQLEVGATDLLRLRIGIHTGDIVQDADGVYGDGVNVASRIESLAAPGGVMISSKVFDEIKNHHSISVVPIGVVRLKKLENRVQLFALANDGIVVPALEEVRAKTETTDEGEFWPVEGEVVGAGGAPVPIPPEGLGEAFLKRLRDRAVAQWAIVYLATAWVVLQIVEFSASRMGAAPLVHQAAGVVAFAGFFVALVVAWFHGEKGPQPIRRAEIVLLTAVSLGTGVAISILPRTPPSPSPTLGGAGIPQVLVEEDRPSIAALPWANRSGTEADAIFTDGIHDEILTRLSMIRGLRVISRQSVVQFRQSPLSARDIASALGVRYLLEGGLLRAGDSVRLNVQLVDALTDDHVWAASYDRTLSVENLLAIQAEIATTIADTLRASVTASERRAILRPETDDLAAYDFYLQGRSYFVRPGYRRDDFLAAEELFTRAVRTDPDFALAHAHLSQVHGTLWWERFDPSPERLEAQEAAAREAFRLQPDLAEAHVALAWMHYVRGEYDRALEEYREALARAPSDAGAVAGIGYAHRRMGDWPEVYAAFETASRLNPRDANLFYDLGGHSFGTTRRYAQAVAAYDRALELAPDLHDAALARGKIFIHWLGQMDSLRVALRRVPGGLHQPELDLRRMEFALWDEDPEGLLGLVRQSPYPVLITQIAYYPTELFAAWAHRMRGDSIAAVEAFDAARRHLEPLAAERPQDLRVLFSLGFAYAGLGRTEEAADLAARAAEARGSEPGAPLGMRTFEDAARLLAQSGRPEAALGYLEQVMRGSSSLSGHSLRLDPLLAPLRGLQEFDAIVEANIPAAPGTGQNENAPETSGSSPGRNGSREPGVVATGLEPVTSTM